MEDSITENEKQQVLSSREHEDEKEGAAKEVNIKVVEDNKSGAVGFINQFISNFTQGEEEKQGKEEINDDVEDKTIGPGDKEQEENKARVESEEDNKQMISNMVSSPHEKQAGKAGDEFLEDGKTQPEKDGNGVIDNILSNLPTPLPDDAAPASDEASILIHSIIHD
ncbi:uncharacterized protein LOC141661552 [Apium graveolens]|uniref:uncharacterized protein LOC141661552 n=1 Tax=Apium graveolens TaxID=4045 RepID=UPI003D7BA23E